MKLLFISIGIISCLLGCLALVRIYREIDDEQKTARRVIKSIMVWVFDDLHGAIWLVVGVLSLIAAIIFM